jgi:hypothetical protein
LERETDAITESNTRARTLNKAGFETLQTAQLGKKRQGLIPPEAVKTRSIKTRQDRSRHTHVRAPNGIVELDIPSLKVLSRLLVGEIDLCYTCQGQGKVNGWTEQRQEMEQK